MKANEILHRALASLDEAGVAWVLLRDSPSDPTAGDVDLLVHPDHLRRLEKVLAIVGFLHLRAWGHWPHRFYYSYAVAADAWIKLDVVDRMVFEGASLPDDLLAAILRNRRRVDGVWRLSAADEFWLLLLHCLLADSPAPERHSRRLVSLSEEGVEEGSVYARLAVCPTAVASAIGLVRTAAWLEADPVRRRLRGCVRRLRSRAPLVRLAEWLQHRFSPSIGAGRAGMRVAILGPDGAGKSTAIQALDDRLPLPTRSFYLGLYGVEAERRGSEAQPRRVLMRRVLRLWRAYLAGWYHRFRGRLVLYDRHGYEALMPAISGRSSSRRRLLRMLVARLAPRPELVILLDAPAKMLHDRKPEHAVSQLCHQRQRYQALARRLPASIPTVVVDTTGGAEDVHRQLARAIWRCLSDEPADQEARTG